VTWVTAAVRALRNNYGGLEWEKEPPYEFKTANPMHPVEGSIDTAAFGSAKGETTVLARVRKKSERSYSPASQLAGWARLGVESFLDAHKIGLDLTARQKAVVVGMVRERLDKAIFRPGASIAKFTDRSIESSTAAGKFLLDLAARETVALVEGLKEAFHIPIASGAAAEVLRHRVETLIEMQEHLLDAAAEQARALAGSYYEGNGLRSGASVAELARRAIEGFVETEKKFLDLAAREVTAAAKDHGDRRKPARNRKVLTQLAREGVEQYIEVQKKLLELAIEQLEFTGEAVGEPVVPACKEASISWADLIQKSVQNFVTTQKALMHLAIKPVKQSREAAEGTEYSRPRR
jgi:hypothetical protein